MGEFPTYTISSPVGPKQNLIEYRYVGNKMAAFVMQTMGCDVAALNTVQFSMQTQANDLRSPSLGCSLLFQCY